MFEFNPVNEIDHEHTKIVQVVEPRPMTEEQYCSLVLAQKLAALILRGMSFTEACVYECLPLSLFKQWYKIGRKMAEGRSKGDQCYLLFFNTINRAKIEYKALLVDAINVKAHKRWQAAAYLLEREEKKEKEKTAKKDIDKDTRIFIFNTVKDLIGTDNGVQGQNQSSVPKRD